MICCEQVEESVAQNTRLRADGTPKRAYVRKANKPAEKPAVAKLEGKAAQNGKAATSKAAAPEVVSMAKKTRSQVAGMI